MREARLKKIVKHLKDYTKKSTKKERIKDVERLSKEFDTLEEILRSEGLHADKYAMQEQTRFVRYFFFLSPREEGKAISDTVLFKISVHLGLTESRFRAYFDWQMQAVAYEIPRRKLVDVECVDAPREKIVGLKELLLQPIAEEEEGGRYATMLELENSISLELTKAAHILIGGRTGVGKSCLIHSFLISLMARYTPEEIKFLLIDYKRVEFSVYQNLSYLIGRKVFCEFEESFSALESTVEEVERRLELFERLSVKNLIEYNQKAKELGLPPLANIAVVFDEFADGMLADWLRMEKAFTALLSRGAVAGIHLVLSTQRVDTGVLPMIVRALCVTRIALRVSTACDSRLLLGGEGAEVLLGHGDALYKTSDMTSPMRGQVGYISQAEIEKVVAFLRKE